MIDTLTLSPGGVPADEHTVVAALCHTDAYSPKTQRVELIETHISWVFLTDKYVYKLKKPVTFDFLDFSSIERRRRACEDEVQLNRRLARNVYLGVVPVTESASGIGINGQGKVIDWLVWMRRLPSDRSMAHLIREGLLTDGEVDQVATLLGDFCAQLPPEMMRPETFRYRLGTQIQQNQSVAQGCSGLADIVERIYESQLSMLQSRSDLIDNRVLDGRVVEGHGDLRPDHIYLNPAPIVIDCIEFNRELRHVDVVDELGFLAMECAFLGATHVGARILDHYSRVTGDDVPVELLAFYMTYRAGVRAKVHLLRAQQLRGTQREAQLRIAGDYVNLADQLSRTQGLAL